MTDLRVYDSGVISEPAGNDVFVQFTLGEGTFQLMSLRLSVIQAAPKGAIPVIVNNTLKQSDGTFLTLSVARGYATELFPFVLSTQPIVYGVGKIVVKTVAASAADAHRIAATYRRVKR